ncbi:MAG: exodeoxyribonuclease VII large subunit [Candidatus Saccharimonadales bacterium]
MSQGDNLEKDVIVWSVSDFVAVFNQTIEYAYPVVYIEGELANFRISKNKWVYFDLKDEESSIRNFGTVYTLPGPLEEGMRVVVCGVPKLHPQYGFSLSFQSIHLIGEGTIKKAYDLLRSKLENEGLFDVSRKRRLPYPPKVIGLIASSESAAYHDFIKVINQRWVGLMIRFFDVQVQGEVAPGQIIEALNLVNSSSEIEVVVITRGGGSPEDLSGFNDERVVRAVAASRIPSMVAIGHEVDLSLAELAADLRASTPSNAAELLVPDKNQESAVLESLTGSVESLIRSKIEYLCTDLDSRVTQLGENIAKTIHDQQYQLEVIDELLELVNPKNVMKRGYTLVRNHEGELLNSSKKLAKNDNITVEFIDGKINSLVTGVEE